MVARTAGPCPAFWSGKFILKKIRTTDRISENPDYGPDQENPDQIIRTTDLSGLVRIFGPVRAAIMISINTNENVRSSTKTGKPINFILQ